MQPSIDAQILKRLGNDYYTRKEWIWFAKAVKKRVEDI
jgi:hypothetical protein